VLVRVWSFRTPLKQNAKEHLHAQWRISTLTAATMKGLVETEIQIGRTPDESDIQQPHHEENEFDAGCQQFVDEIIKLFYKSVL
jgi:hypothetical protein